LTRIVFTNPVPELARMRGELKAIVMELFEEATRPYLIDPELVRN